MNMIISTANTSCVTAKHIIWEQGLEITAKFIVNGVIPRPVHAFVWTFSLTVLLMSTYW